MAASLLENHGVDALTVVEQRLAELQRDYESGRLCAAEAVELGLWRQTGRAVLEIMKGKPSDRDWMH
jgi:hypothetical protein